jgi:hypothetical protein
MTALEAAAEAHGAGAVRWNDFDAILAAGPETLAGVAALKSFRASRFFGWRLRTNIASL